MTERLQPQLRFPEFKKDWENTSLGKLMSFKNGVNATKEQYGTGYKFINVLDIINNNTITHEKIIGSVNISEKEFEKNIVEYGDILFQRSSETREEVGQSNVYLDKVTPSTFGGFVIRGKKTNDYDSLYIHYLLKTTKARIEITTKSGGSTRYNVGQETLSNVIISKSVDLVEHQKIADYLFSIDQKINILTMKKAELSRYKNAMMQQLFSQKIRFRPNCHADPAEIYPDWEEKRLGNFIEIKVGATPSTTNQNYWGGDIGWINSGELKDRHILKPSKFITELGFKKTSTYILPMNTVVLAMTGATLGKLGLLKIATTANQSVAGFIPNGQFVSEYLYYYLLGNQNIILQKAGGAAQIGINKFNIENLVVNFPTIDEQQKIADFLSTIDEIIGKVREQITQMQAFKKAMLQQMFV